MPKVESTPLTPTDPGPVMVSWAHDANGGHEANEAWRETVLQFVFALRAFGLDADVDLFHLHEPGVDWSRYGPTQIRDSAWTVVAVNGAWRERFEGSNDSTKGAGAVAEADELLGIFAEDQKALRRRVVLAVLPGASAADVPARLSGVPRFEVGEFTQQGMDDLLRTLTGQPRYVPPPVGTVPVLPPATLDSASATVQAAAETSATSSLGVGAPPESELRDQSAVLSAALRAIADHPSVQEAASVQTEHLAEGLRVLVGMINRTSSSSPGFQEVQRTAAVAAQKAITSSLAGSASSGGAARAASRLADLLAQVGEAVEGEDRCWVLLAGVLEDPDAGAAMEGHDGRPVRQRRQEQVSTWISRTLPPVLLGQELAAVRTGSRVVLSAPPAHAVSPAWRLELGDHGEAVAAANIAGEVVTGSPFHPPQDGRTQYPDLHLPVRADLLELWLLTQVQLVANHLASMAAGEGDATVFFQARLLLPGRLSHPEAYPRHGVRLVAATRDEDGHRSADSAVPGATDLQLGLAPPESGPLRTTVEALGDPARLIRTTRSMAVELLDRFGVEDTSVLRADGTLDELAAADQQAVWQHAGGMGLARDEVSPIQRRQRYDELLAQARTALRR